MPVTDGLVAANPATPPAYEAVASRSYLIMTLTGSDPVRPSSDGSVWANAPETDLSPTNVEVGVSAVAVNFDGAAPPATATIVPSSTNAPSNKPNVLACLTLLPLSSQYGRREPGLERAFRTPAPKEGPPQFASMGGNLQRFDALT